MKFKGFLIERQKRTEKEKEKIKLLFYSRDTDEDSRISKRREKS